MATERATYRAYRTGPLAVGLGAFISLSACTAGLDAPRAVEFCLDGEFDLGARLQGLAPQPGELSPSSWCVVTEATTERVHFTATGNSNPDMAGSFAVSYLPPDVVRIVNRDAPPDVDFAGAAMAAEAQRYRRIDPLRLVAELRENPYWIVRTTPEGRRTVRFGGDGPLCEVWIEDDRLRSLTTEVDLPLRGRVTVEWTWEWDTDETVAVSLRVDSTLFLQAEGSWRTLSEAEASAIWEPSGGVLPESAPGDRWPARVAMELETLADGVHLVRGVRTGFHHLVVETEHGLVIGDAPAGWVELPQIPPADLVPGLGISGLSEMFVDFLAQRFPGQAIHAVALTHAHDDHVGGARAFAATGADVYAPAGVADFLEVALNRPSMPSDRLTDTSVSLDVLPVDQSLSLAGGAVQLIELGPGPHVVDALGVWARDAGYFFQSDLHVPSSDADAPRPERAVTECWFARWATANLPGPTVVISSHRAIQTPVSRLERYLASDLCRPA